MGIEPTSSAWKAEVLPLNYTRLRETDTRNQGVGRRMPHRAMIFLLPIHPEIYVRFQVCSF